MTLRVLYERIGINGFQLPDTEPVFCLHEGYG